LIFPVWEEGASWERDMEVCENEGERRPMKKMNKQSLGKKAVLDSIAYTFINFRQRNERAAFCRYAIGKTIYRIGKYG